MSHCPDHSQYQAGDCLPCARQIPADVTSHLAAVRAALAAAPRSTRTEHPDPDPVRDLARARAATDRRVKP